MSFQDKERADMHAKIAAQKQEYMDRQAAAARYKAKAEDQVKGHPDIAAPIIDGRQQQRRQWQNVDASEPKTDELARDPPKRGEVILSPEQRRAAWEDMQEAARRNRQQAGADDRPGGLAAFLGVPDPPKGNAKLEARSLQRTEER